MTEGVVDKSSANRKFAPVDPVQRLLRLGIAIMAIIWIGVTWRYVTRTVGRAPVWDDAYMFSRYAGNLLHYHTIAWNPGGPPTYGLTSLLFLTIVVPLRALIADPAVVMIASSGSAGVLFVGLLLFLLLRGVGRDRRGVAVVLVAAGAGLAAIGHWGAHFLGGMDTTFALLFVTAYLLAWKQYEGSRSPRAGVWVGAIGGLAYLARPDLLIFTLLVPVAVMALSRADREARRRALIALCTTLAMTVVWGGAATLYFHTPVPLPFYAKALSLYQGFRYDLYRPVAAEQLAAFLGQYALFVGAIALNAVVTPRRWWNELSAADKGFLLATVAFIVYYRFFVLQIMFPFSRFYYPTLPVIIFLGCLGLARIADPHSGIWSPQARGALRTLATVVVIAVVATALWSATSQSIMALCEPPAAQSLRASVGVGQFYTTAKSRWWFRLDRFSRLPDGLTMAATEVGYPCALNPRKTVIDLSGLNEPLFAKQKFSADRLFRHYRPDIIYLPHAHYAGMLRQITSHPFFRTHYRYYEADDMRTILGVAIYRDSPYYRRMQAIMEAHQ